MKTLHLFEAFGIELEYMIVNAKTLDPMPNADLLLDSAGEKDNGSIGWSNELALHVLEIKTNGPTANLSQAILDFQKNIQEINQKLNQVGACLLSGAAHPWMKPETAKLWPHECNEIYSAYDRIFGCSGHGWVNLQSTHLNLPFANDEEFKKLHTAIRLVLPLLPALAASSPFMDGKVTGMLDTRLHYYNTNQRKIPQISGHIIPERVKSRVEYEEKIFGPSFRAIKPHDPLNILQYEWLNSRGAIARFNRMAIEIRILDIQECPKMDIGIVGIIIEVLKNLVNENWASFDAQWSFAEEHLAGMYHEAIRIGGKAQVNDLPYLQLFGCDRMMSMQTLWQHILEKLGKSAEAYLPVAKIILEHGCLAERMLKAYKNSQEISHIYQDIKECLSSGEAYLPKL
jgi:glutamate---cysteine ligase / carboxylate-amine ligase